MQDAVLVPGRFRCKLKAAVPAFGEEFFRQCPAAVDIILLDQSIDDRIGHRLVHSNRLACGGAQQFVFEQICIDNARAIRDGFRDFMLQALGKTLVALAGNNGQHVDILYLVPQQVGVHAFASLVDAEAQAAAHFLALAHLAAALLQGADLEHIGVVPTFPQGGVGEDKPHRRALGVKVQQQFLVFHDKVVGIGVIRGLGLAVTEFAVGHAAFLVNREVPGVGLLGRDGPEILKIRIFAKFLWQRTDNIAVFLLKHGGKEAVLRLPGGVILAVMADFVNEEQAEDLDPAAVQFPFPLKVGQNRLPDLNAAQLVLVDFADHIAHIEFEAV